METPKLARSVARPSGETTTCFPRRPVTDRDTIAARGGADPRRTCDLDRGLDAHGPAHGGVGGGYPVFRPWLEHNSRLPGVIRGSGSGFTNQAILGSNISILRPQDPLILFLIAVHVINSLAIRIDNDDYGVAFSVGPHIDVVFLIRPTHQIP